MLCPGTPQLTVKRRLRRYFSSFWNWVNLALLTALFVVLGSYVHMVTAARYRNLKLNEAMLSQNQYDVIVDYGLAWRYSVWAQPLARLRAISRLVLFLDVPGHSCCMSADLSAPRPGAIWS